MKTLPALAMALLLVGCGENSQPIPSPPRAEEATYNGRIAEILEVNEYVYLRVESDQGTAWIATSLVWVNVGDEITFPGGVLMENFHSEELGRTFDGVLFVDYITVVKPEAERLSNFEHSLPAGHPAVSALPGTPAAIEPLEGGFTVAQVYASYPDIAGQEVTLRAMVVKFSPNIMGTNWVTLQDGTGVAPDDKLTVTTNDSVAVGDVVEVTGVCRKDVDLGYGYSYKLLLQEAKVKQTLRG